MNQFMIITDILKGFVGPIILAPSGIEETSLMKGNLVNMLAILFLKKGAPFS